MPINEIIDRAVGIAERTARAVVPDLEGRPVYVIQPSADFPRQRLHGSTGCFHRDLDLAFQPSLELAGRWSGRGVGVVVDAEMICAMRLDFEAERTIVGTVLHELCHWLDRPESNTAGTDARQEFIDATEHAPPRSVRGFPVALLTHSESWQRLCAHVWFRCSHGGGYCLQPHQLSFGSAYSGLEFLHAPHLYIEALWTELVSNQYRPLREIADTEPPRAFLELWDEVLLKFAEPVAA